MGGSAPPYKKGILVGGDITVEFGKIAFVGEGVIKSMETAFDWHETINNIIKLKPTHCFNFIIIPSFILYDASA